MKVLSASAMAGVGTVMGIACVSMAWAEGTTAPPTRPFSSGARWYSLERRAGAEECIEPEAFERGVRQRLTSGFDPEQSALRVRVVLAPAPGGGFVGVVRLEGPRGVAGTREIVSPRPSCADLGQAVVVATALALDMQTADTPTNDAESGEARAGANDLNSAPDSKPPISQDRDGSLKATIAEDPERHPNLPATEEASHSQSLAQSFARGARFALGGGGSIQAGYLPKPTAGGSLSVLFRPKQWFTAEASASSFLASDAVAATPTRQVGASFKASVVTISGCFSIAENVDRGLWACTGVWLERLSPAGYGFDRSSPNTRWLLGGSLGAVARQLIVGPVFASVSAHLDVPFRRDSFGYATEAGESTLLYRPSPVAGRLEMSLTWWLE